jgi:hypothetical protein
MHNFINNWRAYIIAENEQLLAEDRYDDAAKKYPDLGKQKIAVLMGDTILDYFKKNDPTPNNKYIMWLAKQMSERMNAWREMFPAQAAAEQGDRQQVWEDQIGVHTANLVEAVTFFEKWSQRFKSYGYPTDINSYSFDALARAVEGVKEQETNKEKRAKEKEIASETSDIIFKDSNFMVVRPKSTEASCYWGRETQWCISATKSQNYFNSYTGEGKAFYFVLMKNEENFATSEWRRYKKLALVWDVDNDFEEGFDAEDTSMDEDEVVQQIAINLVGTDAVDAYEEWSRYWSGNLSSIEGEFKEEEPESYEHLTKAMKADGYDPGEVDPEDWWNEYVVHEWYQIKGTAESDVEQNPAGPTEAQFSEIESEYSLDNVHVSYDEYDLGKWYWNGGMSFDFSDLDWREYGATLDNYESELEIRGALDGEGIYVDEIEAYENELQLDFTPDDVDESRGLDGFRSFMNRMSEYDEIYDSARESLIDLFTDNDLLDIEASPYGKLRGKAKEFENFEVDTSGGKVDFRAKMQFDIKPELQSIIKKIAKYLPSEKYAPSATAERGFEKDEAYATAWEEQYRRIQNNFGKAFNVRRDIPPSERGRLKSLATNRLLDAISFHFLKAQAEAAKQLNLPGIPAAKVKQLVTPSAVRLSPYSAFLDTEKGTVEAIFQIETERRVGEIQHKAVAAFTEYFDKHFNELESLVRQVLIGLLRDVGEAELEGFEQRANAPQQAVNENKKKIKLIVKRKK